jgi:hypothetical protein
MPANGNIPSSQRRKILGVSLFKPTANAVARLVADAKRDGVTISIYLPVGGYRDLGTQKRMHDDRFASQYNIDPKMAVTLAPVGSSTHGFATAVDFKTSDGGAWLQKHAHEFGFIWPFGNGDFNHWQHDGRTAGAPFLLPALTNKTAIEQVAKYLRTHKLGTSSAEKHGRRGPVYWRGVQRWGKRNGIFGGLRNGIATAGTKSTERELYNRLPK